MQVTAGFFTLLGYPPLLGRDFTMDDEMQGSDDVVMLSHGLWMRRFNGDPAIVGKYRTALRPEFPVIGVLPRRLQARGRHLPDLQAR